MARTIFVFVLILAGSTAVGAQQLTPRRTDSMRFSKRLMLPKDSYTQHLGFFCKKELQLQKLTSVPVYFRLGSKDYVDYLEQKPNARKNY
jgi:uncharacterized heparinase superfamily protein